MYEQIYFLTQIFFKSLRGNLMFEFLYSGYNGKRGPKRRLSLEKVVALNIFRFHYKVSDLKSYHKLLSDVMIDKIPELPNYENFLKATNKSSVFIYAFMNFLLKLNRTRNSTLHYMDSTPLTVCLNHKIRNHKVTAGYSKRGKSTKGWFFGFKLHGICNFNGDLENLVISQANIPDCKIAEKLSEFSYGTVFADAGYLQKNEVYERMADRGLKFESATRKNMNRLMSSFECFHIKHRSIIESDWGILKGNYQLEYHKARNIHGMFRHFFYSLSAYMIDRSLDFYLDCFKLLLE